MPNAIGAAVEFDDPVTANRVISLDGSFTVGSIIINNSSTFANTLQSNTSGSTTRLLTLDNTTGNATLTASGTSTGNTVFTMNAPMSLTDTLDVTINNTAASSASGAVTFTSTIVGVGGFIKDGDGTTSMTTAAKAYTGATTVNAGILRYTATGASSGTSGITVNSGGQLRLDSSNGVFTFGGGSVTIALNGAGDANIGTTGVGALADSAGGASSLANPVQLASASTITVSSSATSSLVLTGVVSGSGALTKVGAGTLYLNNAANTLNGGVTVSAGTVGGSGLIPTTVAVSGTGTLLGGSGTTGTTLTISNDLTFAPSSIISLTLGASGAHSTLARTGGNWTFDANQMFTLLGTVAAGNYQDIITGLAADPGTEGSWTITNSGATGTFTYDGANIDLVVTVPEPGTILGGALLIGAAAWSQRRRFLGVFTV